jgi:hypothetical protein
MRIEPLPKTTNRVIWETAHRPMQRLRLSPTWFLNNHDFVTIRDLKKPE